MIRLHHAFLCICLFANGCATTVPPAQPLFDDKGCTVPDPNTFKKVGFTLDVAKATFGGATTDAAKVNLTPEIVSLVSQATRDRAVIDYLRCRVTKSYPADEAQWYTQLFAFADTNPTPEQMSTWQKDHPSPAEARLKPQGVGTQQKQLLLMGSGTVVSFLRRYTAVFRQLDANPQVVVLQGGTTTGVSLMSEVFDHGVDQALQDKLGVQVAALAARRCQCKDFVRLPGQDHQQFFEFQVGRDRLKVLLVAASQSALDSLFPKAKRVSTSNGVGVRLKDIGTLIRGTGVWTTHGGERKYTLLAPGRDSATRQTLDEELDRIPAYKSKSWPTDAEGWGLQVERIRQLRGEGPIVAIGTPDDFGAFHEWTSTESAIAMTLLDVDDHPIVRGLYIYGRLRNRRDEGQTRFYMDSLLPPFLQRLVRELKDAGVSDDVLSASELDLQLSFFHLRETQGASGWTDTVHDVSDCVYGITAP